MAHGANIEAVDKLLRQIMGNNSPFGGKVVLGIGNFRQVGPVVKLGGPSACRMASILSLPIWNLF
jgi:hypothetical protein